MPLLKSAKKKLRQDKKRQKRNASQKDYLKEVLKKARKDPTVENIRIAVVAADKAVKKRLIHQNKAARIKSSLAKLIAGEPTKQESAKKTIPVKKATTKKKSVKKTGK